MKIGWVTPFNAKSAIARFSADVTKALLAQGHQVSIIRSETGEALKEPVLSSKAPILTDERGWGGNDFDIVAVNIGDNYPFHGGILKKINEVHAVGIFHDWFIAHLFYDWFKEGNNFDEGRATILRLYGAEVWNKFEPHLPDEYIERARQSFPMTEWYAERLDGAVVHSRFYMDRVRSACPGPVAHLPLAYQGRVIPSETRKEGKGALQLLTFGMVNANKRVESILRALGKLSADKSRISYVVAGSISSDEKRRLENVAQQCGVTHLKFTGWVPDKTLDDLIDQADVICCLRYPALEGASASVLEAMQSERPVIVTDTGCYAEIPDGLVLKVRPEQEVDDLQKHLTYLIELPEERRKIGKRAAEWARRESDPARYARDAVAHFEKVITAQPLLRCGEALGQQAGQWGLAPDDPFLKRLASTFQGLWKES